MLKYNIDQTIVEPCIDSTNSELILIAKSISEKIDEKLKHMQHLAHTQELIGDSVQQDGAEVEVVGDAVDYQDTVSTISRTSQTSILSLTHRRPKIHPKTNKAVEARLALKDAQKKLAPKYLSRSLTPNNQLHHRL